MSTKRFRIGSVAVLFSIVILCVAIFSILTVVTALSDQKMADRYAQQITKTYTCLNFGEVWLARADAYLQGEGPLPEDTREEDGILTTEIHFDGTVLLAQVRRSPEGLQILRWDLTNQWQPEQSWTLLTP